MQACCGGTSMGSLQQPGRVQGPVFAPIVSPVTKFSQQLKFNFPRPCRSSFFERRLVVERRASSVSVPNVEMSSKRVLSSFLYNVKEMVIDFIRCFDFFFFFCLIVIDI